MNIYSSINNLIAYGIDCGLITERDACYSENMILAVLGLDNVDESDFVTTVYPLHEILSEITDFAVSKGICENSVTQRDLFDTKIMGCLMPRPSEMSVKFD